MSCRPSPRALSLVCVPPQLDNWVQVMWDTYDSTGTLALPLFPAIIIFGNFVTLNIFLAILLSTFSGAAKREVEAAAEQAEAEAIEVQEAAKAAAKITANASLAIRKRHGSPSRSPSRSPSGSPQRSPTQRSTTQRRSPMRKTAPRGPSAWDISPNRWTVPAKRVAQENARESTRQEQSSCQSSSCQPEMSGWLPGLANAGGGGQSAVGFASFALGAEDHQRSDPRGGTGERGQGPVPPPPGGALNTTELAANAARALGPDMTLRATRVFRAHDADDSGEIEYDELQSALRELGLEDEEAHVDAVMRMYDFDGSRSLDLAEFLMLVKDTPVAPPTELGRYLHRNLPEFLKESSFVRAWVEASARRAAATVRRMAEERQKRERQMRNVRRSKMRERHGKYGSLNAWEVAFFRMAFSRSDIDGDGFLLLDEVYQLLEDLDEEPKSNETWDVLDANAARDDLISKEEFLVFISIKRADDAEIAARGGITESKMQQAMRKDVNLRRARVRSQMRRGSRRHIWWGVWNRQLHRLSRMGLKVYLDRLPNLGEFGREGLGEDRARNFQRVIYCNFFWAIQVFLIVASAVLVTSEIDSYVRRTRLAAGMTSLSSDELMPRWMVAAVDSIFLMVGIGELVVKLLAEGLSRTFTSPWNLLDSFCLTSSMLRLMFNFPNMRRMLLSFSSLRIFMLVPRFKKLKLLFESVLRAMPNVLITMASLMVIWLMFAILGVSVFGGTMHQCARVSDASGYPGCGVDFGSKSFASNISCLYAMAPLPPPKDVIPGVTRSTDCGCVWADGERQCHVTTNSLGEELAWVPAYPSFDTTGQALLALHSISTLDGWSRLMYFGMDATRVDHQPARESTYAYPVLFYIIFIIIGVLFATNVFVGVVIDEFKKIQRVYDGSATLTEEQVKWVNTQRLLLRLRPEKKTTMEPPPDHPRRLACFRLVYDEEGLGRPSNAPADAQYHGRAFDRVVTIAIMLNILQLMLYSDPMPPAMLAIYEFLNYLFVVAFAVEAAIRVTAFTLKEHVRSVWNAFDLFLAVFGVASSAAILFAQFGLGVQVNNEPSMRWLRCVRALRIVRLATVSPSLLKMMRTALFASPSIANITIGICLFTSAYAQFGMAFLGTLVYDYEGAGFSRHANFETAFRAFSALVRMSTGDSWTALLADAVHNPHVPGIEPPLPFTVFFFFLFYMSFMQWILISIFVAIILEYFADANSEEGVQIKFEDIESFQRKWLEFDIKGTSYIRTVDLGLLLYACKPPLVSVRIEWDGDTFFAAGKLVRPTKVSQLEKILVELDIPEHDGTVHFLEVLLALLQRLTGVIHEEQIMAKLLEIHPSYVSTIQHMPPITGSTADPYVKEDIVQHLKRGLKATGLLDGEEDDSFERSFKTFKTSKSSLMRRGSLAAKSFTRRRTHTAANVRDAQEARIKYERETRRASLSSVALSNAEQRDAIRQAQASCVDKKQRAGPSRLRVVGAAVLATALGSNNVDSFKGSGSRGGSSFKGSGGSSFKRRQGSPGADDALTC